jgi:phospho-N-acetylmuramoyl-pentapeptide-transferase
MREVLIAAAVAFVLSLIGTARVIRLFTRLGFGQEIREDGPQTHISKRGTPTMGGVVIVSATVIGYAVAHLVHRSGPTASGLLAIFAMVGMGAIGMADDLIKIRKQRSLGLNARAKLAGQLVVAIIFGVLAQHYRNRAGLTPASVNVSFTRDTSLALGGVGLIVWTYLVFAGTTNGVNLADGADGLCSGTSAMVFGSYVIITFWQFGNSCGRAGADASACYQVRDPLDLALVAAAMMGACFGFLWWNAAPAKIFMGDAGSFGIGGAVAAIAMLSRTELLLLVIGGLYVMETLSVIIQVGVFKRTGRRVFRIAPIHHHFEQLGWPETTVIVRFWIIAGLAVALGLGIFYAEFLSHGPLR